MERVLGFLRRHRTETLVSLAVGLAAGWVVRAAVGFDFVMWDDDVEVYKNPNIQSLSTSALRWAFTDVAQTMRYTPVSWLNWILLHHFFGLDPFAFHLENVLLHMANAALVFWLVRRLLASAAPAEAPPDPAALTVASAIGALLWALHPLRVEPVVWVTQERFTQSIFFCLIALLLYLRFARLPGPAWKSRTYWAAVVASVLSVMSYAVSLALPALLVILDVYPLRRVRPGAGWWWTRYGKALWKEKAPFLVAPVLVGAMNVWGRLFETGHWTRAVPLSEFGVFSRVMQAFYMWAYYLWRPFYPVHLTMLDNRLAHFDPLEPAFVASTALVVALSVMAYRLRHRAPALATLWFSYLVLMVPMLGLTEHPHHPCDRYSYFTGLAYPLLISAGLLALWSRARTRRLALTGGAVAAVLAIVLGGLSTRQALVWRNSETLFRYIIAELGNDPDRAHVFCRLGLFQHQNGRTDEAMENFQKTLQIMPKHYVALAYTGGILLQRRNSAAAVPYFAKALELREDAWTRNGLGMALGDVGSFAEARAQFQKAVSDEPDFVEARYNLIMALVMLGERQAAETEYRILRKLDPKAADALLATIQPSQPNR